MKVFYKSVSWISVILIIQFGMILGQASQDADFNYRELMQKKMQGRELTDDEILFVDRTKREKRKKKDSGPVKPGIKSLGFPPLIDLGTKTYKNQAGGGLYGNGKNEPPSKHLKAALRIAGEIRPLDANGIPDERGKIVMISNGMSNTAMKFNAFIEKVLVDKDIAKDILLVNGARGKTTASDWADPETRKWLGEEDPWEWLINRLRKAGVTPKQVQVLWILQADREPKDFGEFPEHTNILGENIKNILQRMKNEFPNLKIAYISSRSYAGYAVHSLNPEPYAYETGFMVRDLIQRQIDGNAELNYDDQRGAVKTPILLWGPYLWADGVNGRKTDDLVWLREDFTVGDGVHPSVSGRQKVANILLSFFKTDPTSASWFVKK